MCAHVGRHNNDQNNYDAAAENAGVLLLLSVELHSRRAHTQHDAQ